MCVNIHTVHALLATEMLCRAEPEGVWRKRLCISFDRVQQETGWSANVVCVSDG